MNSKPPSKLDSLSQKEIRAFIAFFGGARRELTVFVPGDTGLEMPPMFGKAECNWVPFREFWQEKLPALGLTTFSETAASPALGMVDGSTFTKVKIDVTAEGQEACDAYWAARTLNQTAQ